MVATARVALVTGGSKGIGAAIAARLASEGQKVAALGRDEAALAKVAAETGGLAVTADVTDPAAMDRAIARVEETLGPIDVLVPNAGIAPGLALAATDDATWERVFAVNVTAPFRISRTLLPRMAKRG